MKKGLRTIEYELIEDNTDYYMPLPEEDAFCKEEPDVAM